MFKKLREKCAAAAAAAAPPPPPQVGGLVAGQFSAAFLIARCVGGREQEGKEAVLLGREAYQSKWEANSPFPPAHVQLYANEKHNRSGSRAFQDVVLKGIKQLGSQRQAQG